MKNFRKACRGQKGFTLIELLVVIIILGVLAAVVTLAVTRFIGKGVRESANAEAVTVQAAVVSAMAEANASTLVSACAWYGGGTSATPTTCPTARISDNSFVTAAEFLQNQKLKATYAIDQNGNITNANAGVSNPLTTPWGATKISWNTTTGEWEKYVAST